MSLRITTATPVGHPSILSCSSACSSSATAIGIRSERRLCEEIADRLTFRCFCRMDLDDKVPDHSTFSKNRHGRFRNSDVLRHIFERVVLACITAGLVGGEGFAVDASLIEADANKGRSIPGAEWSKERDPTTASHAVKEYLATLDDAAFWRGD